MLSFVSRNDSGEPNDERFQSIHSGGNGQRSLRQSGQSNELASALDGEQSRVCLDYQRGHRNLLRIGATKLHLRKTNALHSRPLIALLLFSI